MPVATQPVVSGMEGEWEWQEKGRLPWPKLNCLILPILQKPVISGHILGGLQTASIYYSALWRLGNPRSKGLQMAASEGPLLGGPPPA